MPIDSLQKLPYLQLSGVAHYLHDCYETDNRSFGLLNLFASKVSDRIEIDGQEQLACDLSPKLALINYAKAAEIQKKAYLYRKEKSLLYFHLLIVGSILTEKGDKLLIQAPLFYYPASLEITSKIANLCLDLPKISLNYGLLSQIVKDKTILPELYEKLFNQISATSLERNNVITICQLLEDYLPNFDGSNILLYPKLFSTKEVQKIAEQTTEGLTLLPFSCLGLMDKSTESRGVLTELNQLAKSTKFSGPIQSIFTEKVSPHFLSVSRRKPEFLPSILSNSQQKILQSVIKNKVTLVIGPPGTGKSYTIATLAAEHLSAGKSVLISCKTDNALEVIADKIESLIGTQSCLVRAGRGEYLRGLKKFFENLLDGILPTFGEDLPSSRLLLSNLKKLHKQIANVEKRVAKSSQIDQNWANFLELYSQNNQTGFINNTRWQYYKWLQQNENSNLQLTQKLTHLQQERMQLTAKYLQAKYLEQLKKTLKNHRAQLQKFNKAIRSRTNAKQEQIFGQTDFGVILKTLPIWLVKMSDIHEVLPLTTELFDLVIVDEATQSDTASSFPVLQRAKKAVIVGDPHQLRHVSFLSGKQQSLFLQKYNLQEFSGLLDYRSGSLLDIVRQSGLADDEVIFLDEHYRSLPEIIDFSNQNIYAGALKLMKEKPGRAPNGLRLIPCTGKRNEQGVNKVEVEEIIKYITEVITLEKDLPVKTSLGILSPFRDQVDYIVSVLDKHFDLTSIEQHNLLVGTPYDFQGEERDTMLLSMAMDNNLNSGLLNYLNKEEVMNVAITRAGNRQLVYFSGEVEALPPAGLIRKYLEYVRNLPNRSQLILNAQEKVSDSFLKEVQTAFEQNGFQTWPNVRVAGNTIDLMIQKDNLYLAIDLIGFPGRFSESLPIEKYYMLQRAGLTIMPVSYGRWLIDRESVIREIMQELERYFTN